MSYCLNIKRAIKAHHRQCLKKILFLFFRFRCILTDIKEHNIVSELNNSSDRENTERFKFFEKIHIFVIILFPRQRLCLMAFRENETKLYAFAREERKSSSFFSRGAYLRW